MFTGDIVIKGKHADYARFLWRSQNDSRQNIADVFQELMDLYMVAPIIGVQNGLKSPEDNSTKTLVRMFSDKVNKEQLKLKLIYRLVMLCDNSAKLSDDEKISRAFKEDDNEENMKIFNSYVRGGIEWLYEEFTEGANTKDEYIAKINEIVSDYKDEFDIE